MDAGVLETDTTLCEESVPLLPWQRTAVIVAHYLTFVTGTLSLFVCYAKLDILKQRIWSPFLLILSLVWLQIAPAFEIGAHEYEADWELKEAPSDMINASFSFFNFGGVCLLAISLRSAGVPFFRKPSFDSGTIAGIIDTVTLAADLILAITIIAEPFLYIALGRQGSQELVVPVNSAGGILCLFRLWLNVGPNKFTLGGGIGYLVLTLTGVMMLGVYKRECIEFIHVAIGGSFVLSLVPFSIAIWAAEPAKKEEDGATDENTPLFKV